MSQQTIEPPIPLTAPDGRLFGYACPRCLHYRCGIEGGTLDSRVEWSLEMSEKCCRCERCGVAIGRRFGLRCDPCEEAERAERAKRLEAERPEREASEARQDAALAKAKDRNAALVLVRLMSDISEEYWCAGWLISLEYELWPMLEGGARRFGMGEVGEDEVAQLKALSEQAGGWWRYDDTDGRTFVTLDEWREHLSQRTASTPPPPADQPAET